MSNILRGNLVCSSENAVNQCLNRKFFIGRVELHGPSMKHLTCFLTACSSSENDKDYDSVSSAAGHARFDASDGITIDVSRKIPSYWHRIQVRVCCRWPRLETARPISMTTGFALRSRQFCASIRWLRHCWQREASDVLGRNIDKD